jgi:hypothetical protein
MPLLLDSLYEGWSVHGGGQDFLVLADKGVQALPIKAIAKHCTWLRELTGRDVAYAADDLAAYKRNRLRQARVPFHIPGRETFLPFLGIAHRVTGRALRAARPKPIRFGLAAARIVVAGLNRVLPDTPDLHDACTLLGCSHVTAIQAFDEIERSGLATRTARPHGHGKVLVWLQQPRERWAKAESALSNPVRTVVGLDTLPDGFPRVVAGESALAAHTRLSTPEQPVFAIHATGSALLHLKRASVPVEDAAFRVELWKFSPTFPGHRDLDPFSLLLATRGSTDERVEGAREELLEALAW